jgi:hypothetical protein
MRSYGTIPTRFWPDGMGALVKGNGTAIAMVCYLMSSPHSNMIGIYRLPMDYIIYDTGLSEPEIRETLSLLERAEFAFYDEKAKTIYVPSFAAVQIAPSLKPTDNRIRAIQHEVDKTLHFEFKKRFLERYGELYHLSPFEAPSEGLGRGSKAPLPASERTETSEHGTKTVDNQGAPKGLRSPFDTVPDLVPEGVKRGLGREEDRRGSGEASKARQWIEQWPAQMAKKDKLH